MILSKTKALVAVFVLILFTGFITVGCRQNPKNAWVNTNSMPGKTFKSDLASYGTNGNNASVVNLGSDPNEPDVRFGPKDVSFNFRDLK